MTLEQAWEKFMGTRVLPSSEAQMRTLAEAFFIAGKLAQLEELEESREVVRDI